MCGQTEPEGSKAGWIVHKTSHLWKQVTLALTAAVLCYYWQANFWRQPTNDPHGSIYQVEHKTSPQFPNGSWKREIWTLGYWCAGTLKNVFSVDIINEATGVLGDKLEIQVRASELRKKSDIWAWKIQAKHDKFKVEHPAKHPQSLLTVLCF